MLDYFYWVERLEYLYNPDDFESRTGAIAFMYEQASFILADEVICEVAMEGNDLIPGLNFFSSDVLYGSVD